MYQDVVYNVPTDNIICYQKSLKHSETRAPRAPIADIFPLEIKFPSLL